MRRVLLWNVLLFLLGILAAVYISADWLICFFWISLVVLVKGLFGRERHFLLLLCMCLSFLAGGLGVEWISVRQTEFLEQYQDNYVYIYGKVVNDPDVNEDNTKLTVKCSYVELDGEKYGTGEKVLVSVSDGEKQWRYGDIVSVEGVVYQPIGQMNDKGFSYASYLRAHGVAATMYCEEEQVRVYRNEAGWPWKIKNFVLGKIDQFVPGDAGALLKGITLGDKSSFTPEMKTMFARAGISHIVVVSGMHMSILMLFVMYVCKRLRLKKWARAIAATVVVFFFMCMVGFTPSVLRAGITCIVAMLAILLRRKKDFLTTMAVAAAAVTLLNPYSLFDVSFQLSFAATLGIVYLANPIKKLIDFLPDMLAEIIAMSVAANIATLPIVVWYFSDVSVIAVLTNVIVVPFVNILFIGTFFMAALGGIFPPIGNVLGFLLGTLANMILYLVEQLAALPYATISLPQPPMIVNVYYYAIVFAIWMLTERRRVTEMKLLLCCTIALMVSFCLVQYWTADTVRLEFINVGQGDSCMVRMPNRHYILIDTGEKGNGSTNNVVDYLKKRGIYTLDCIYISHADSDHSGGLEEVLNSVKVKKVAVPQMNIRSEDMEELIQMVTQKGVPVEMVSAGDYYQVENMEIRALWPVPVSGSNLATDNNLSMVLKISYQGNVALFMGDMGGEAEEMLVHSGTELRCNILKVSHHGSKTATGDAMLDVAAPQYSMISVGKNSYGHPDPDVMSRLENHKSEILRTDILGNIVFSLNRSGRLALESR